MDAIQFIEEVCEVKLLDYQKAMIRYAEEHKDWKVLMPRSRGYAKSFDLLTLYMFYKMNSKED